MLAYVEDWRDFLGFWRKIFSEIFHIFDENIAVHWIKPLSSGTNISWINLNDTLNLESSADEKLSNLKGRILERLENLIPTYVVEFWKIPT